MATVLQPFVSAPTSIALLQPRPSSAEAFQATSQQFSSPPLLDSTSRSMYNGQNQAYRTPSTVPVQPYVFQPVPPRVNRSQSTPLPALAPIGAPRHAHNQSVSNSSTTSSDISSQPSTKDDSVMGSKNGSHINLSSAVPDLSLTAFEQPTKHSPERYRRPAQKRLNSSNTVTKTTSPPTRAEASAFSGPEDDEPSPAAPSQSTVDDMVVAKSGNHELAKRYRRRSLSNFDAPELSVKVDSQSPLPAVSTPTSVLPSAFQESAMHEQQAVSLETNASPANGPESMRNLHSGAVHSTARVSTDPVKRSLAPSPLSKQTVDVQARPTSAAGSASPPKPKTYAAVAQAGVNTLSPAVQQLAAVSDKDLNKGMKSRLRRAFSFGSAQELAKAGTDSSNTPAATAAAQQAQQAKEQHQQKVDEELDAEQQEIARRQEEAGIGAGIYSGQGGFSGSTDNLSISSTASSASMMLRKMGRGAKKGARSIKGLFRPKSVIGVPAADRPVANPPGTTMEPSIAQVSRVTVEAERQRVNVNPDASATPQGITGFPKLERNSLDAVASAIAPPSRGSADGSDSVGRRSMVGSDKDRAEVLAAVKMRKGILKRSATASPNGSPVVRPSDAGHTPGLPLSTNTPTSSMPSTPRDVHGRAGSLHNVTPSDYFSPRMASMTKSMPSTPNGSTRSITFSPRIQFHDAWSAADYDRRGEIATCNRLTPMLAQQIKEELNTFKMEMEVHELSKPHTHFF